MVGRELYNGPKRSAYALYSVGYIGPIDFIVQSGVALLPNIVPLMFLHLELNASHGALVA